VLPLENLTGDPAQDYFVDGMTDALITDLAKIRSLHVISRTSAMQYKARTKPLPQIARELNVDAVVEGTVARSGDRVRIDAQLIHAATDRHLWANSYQRDLRDILALQNDVARAVAAEVQAELTPEEWSGFASTRTINPEAYEAYLKGRYFSDKGTAEGLNTGIEYFKQAIQKEPSYALAYAGLADAWSFLGFGLPGAPPFLEIARNARTAAMKALDLDDKLSEAHAALGFTKFLWDWEWEAAEKEYQRALQLNPNNAIGYHRYAVLLLSLGRYEEALRNFERAHQIDPLSPLVNRWLVESLVKAGRSDQALEQARKMLELHSGNYYAHFGAGVVYALLNMYKEAIPQLEQASSISASGKKLGANASARRLLAHSFLATGRREEAEKILNELIRDTPTFASHIGDLLVDLGRTDEAFEWFEKCYATRCAGIVHFKTTPYHTPLQSDPRYKEMVRRMGYPE
jgi:TolB-like protein/Flp pilus assembly protein TadD